MADDGARKCACGRPVSGRSHSCSACRQRRARGHELEHGAACLLCPIHDRRMLRRARLVDVGEVVLCANHLAVVGRRELSLRELRAELG